MPEIGRNDPCPCGSGKKYKKCCVGKADAARVQEADAQKAVLERERAIERDIAKENAEFDRVDALSTQVPRLIDAGRLDEAEAIARELLAGHADLPDGIERLAEVIEARGKHAEAIELYRQARDFKSNRFQTCADRDDWINDKIAELQAAVEKARAPVDK